MDSQHEELSATLVMRRFFEALRTENLMAVELWANHPEFDGGKVNYGKTFDDLVGEGKLSMDTIEWLLEHAKHSKAGFFNPPERKKRHGTWRAHVCSWVRGWMNEDNFATMTPQQRRIVVAVHQLGWLTASMKLLKSPAHWELLQECATPAKVLELALTEPNEYVKNKFVTKPFCRALVHVLLDKGNLDLTACGDELVREYKSDEGCALALKLIKARDTNVPMPREFTSFLQDVIEKHKLYQRVARDLPHLLESKTIDP